jgi:AraC family transcriptional regulator, regulatory protein of adaptative response / methylated-DNA-[protein]-cysteine methyltransferase
MRARQRSGSMRYISLDGVNVMKPDIRYGIAGSTLGAVLVAMSAAGVCAIFLGDDSAVLEKDLRQRFADADLRHDDKALRPILGAVVKLIERPERGLDVPLDIRGTHFQRRVWNALREIPAGKTASYADIANRLGEPKAMRAVAQACGANPIAVMIPCHRVVRSDGALSGYRWGVERKRVLLQRERPARTDSRSLPVLAS